ncbi:MAG: DNA-formamidopyrimidine glycosylase [Armatimonadetes bacterium]|nr:DNA-formamidopyrimidine glycosylase [Anaerolineae bacterium]
MPELPEVETVVRSLRQPLIGRTVRGMWQDSPNAIQLLTPDAMQARLVGQTIHAVQRRAKYIVMALSDDLLVIHLKMTGRLYVCDAAEQHDADRWVHFKLALDNGTELRFSDSRRFGRVYLTSAFDAISKGAAALGPEPLEDDFTVDAFRARLQGRAKALKALLLDQSFIAGVGNIYADEALLRAGLHPLRRADTLSDDDIARLHSTIRAALSDGVQHEGASINWYRKPDGGRGEAQDYLYAYGRTGLPCRICGTPIIKLRVAQRGTHLCPTCQPLSAADADITSAQFNESERSDVL